MSSTFPNGAGLLSGIRGSGVFSVVRIRPRIGVKTRGGTGRGLGDTGRERLSGSTGGPILSNNVRGGRGLSLRFGRVVDR